MMSLNAVTSVPEPLRESLTNTVAVRRYCGGVVLRYSTAPLKQMMSDAKYQYQFGSINRMKSCVVNLRVFALFVSRFSSLCCDIRYWGYVLGDYFVVVMIVMTSVANDMVVEASEIQNERFWLISDVAALYLLGLTITTSFCSR
jgi:hypothetical protein